MAGSLFLKDRISGVNGTEGRSSDGQKDGDRNDSGLQAHLPMLTKQVETVIPPSLSKETKGCSFLIYQVSQLLLVWMDMAKHL